MAKKKFTFEISLSVLNHLGRQLYRSFATVLGEAISNSWDADAQNVWIDIDRKNNGFFIKDDGKGMTADDFEKKFLKIGYSKRKEGINKSDSGRPFIGRKGIGKLALLSCANRITIITKTEGGDYVGGIIDNSGLDNAIKDDLTPGDYPLEDWNIDDFADHIKDHKHGTIIRFEEIKEGIKSSFKFLTKTIALYFRFSLLDNSFAIFVKDRESIDKYQMITHKHLRELAEKTQFLWEIGEYQDPYIEEIKAGIPNKEDENEKALLESEQLEIEGYEKRVKGFIASVMKPRDLKVMATDERVGVDLFVNGRLRERDILKHIPTARIVESYLYGQIHFDELDGDTTDRFTSSREGVVADDKKYKDFLETLRKTILEIVETWDTWRRKHKKRGDPDNNALTDKDRASSELFNAVSGEYVLPKESANRGKVSQWVNELQEDAAFNFGSYAECFISENLIRKFIQDKGIAITREAQEEITRLKTRETNSKNAGNVSVEIRRVNDDTLYLDMNYLANMVDKPQGNEASLARDAKGYKPMRDAVAHTSLLSDAAKQKLTAVYENIKGRIKTLLT